MYTSDAGIFFLKTFAPLSLKARTSPVSRTKQFSFFTPVSLAILACSFNIKYSP